MFQKKNITESIIENIKNHEHLEIDEIRFIPVIECPEGKAYVWVSYKDYTDLVKAYPPEKIQDEKN